MLGRGSSSKGQAKPTHYRGVQELAIEERRKQVAQLYGARWTLTQIAERLGCHPATISRDVAAIKAEYRCDREGFIEREVIDLEVMEREAWLQYAQTKDAEWFGKRLDVKKRRAELLGLDAAKRIRMGLLSDGTHVDDLSDDELLERYRALTAGASDPEAEAG